MKRLLWAVLWCACWAVPLFAGDSLDDVLNDALLGGGAEAPVSVATTKALPWRETPGIVTVLTAEDIADAGARDLLDVLRLAPGFFSGVDVQGVVSVGLRGLWGQEGKILLLVDGQEFNESLYSSIPAGLRFPVETIERVEIIRGPGSAVYGGYAELGVINVITKAGNGAGASVNGGRLRSAASDAGGTLWAGASEGSAKVHVAVNAARGLRSDRTYTDSAGASYSERGASDLDPKYANVGLGWGDLTGRLILDKTRTTYRDQFDASLDQPARMSFDNYYAELKRAFHPAEGWTVTPQMRVKRQWPWRITNDPALLWNRAADKADYRLAVDRAGDALSWTAGGEYLFESGHTGAGETFSDGTGRLADYGGALFAEAVGRTPVAVATVGGRWQTSNRYGSLFVPRAALTRVMGRAHFKLLYAQAFRAPGLMNFDLNPNIQPEKTNTVEFETGWHYGERGQVTVNVFDISIRRPIVYTVVGANEMYLNADRTGSRGLELTQSWRSAGGHSVSATYAYYEAQGGRGTPLAVPGRATRFLAAPNHRGSVSATLRLPAGMSVTPSVELLGARQGFDYDPAAAGVALRSFSPVATADLCVRFRRLGLEGLSASVTGHDLFNAAPPWIQPYNGGHPPLPGTGRDVGFRLAYDRTY